MSKKRIQWAAPGDVNAFFGLMLDNIADLLLTVGLLAGVFGFPANFALQYMVPGTAIGVLFGDLMFFLMALALARRTGRSDVTAMPLGLDTPSTIAMVLFVLGPPFVHGRQELGLRRDAGGDADLAYRHLFHFSVGYFQDRLRFGGGNCSSRRATCRSAWVADRHCTGPDQLLAAAGRDALSLGRHGRAGDHPDHPGGSGAVSLAHSRVPWARLLVAGTIYYIMAWTGLLGARTGGLRSPPRP